MSSPRMSNPSMPSRSAGNARAKDRSALAHLLHALNQPLTGLQCSLELAVAGPRRSEQYVQVLNESLELTQRMRLLVEAIRELTDDRRQNPGQCETFRLGALLSETADDLLPVASLRGVRLTVVPEADPKANPEAALSLYAERSHLAQLLFRVLESALSLAREDGELRVTSRREREHAVVDISWSVAAPPEHSPFSRAELGLLVAGAGWENAGAEWTATRAEDRQGRQIRLPLTGTLPSSENPLWKEALKG